MASVSKICIECGMPITIGISNCAHCGAKVGTLFDETAGSAIPARNNPWSKVAKQIDLNQKIEKAQDRANASVILGLLSFIPLIGLPMGFIAVASASISARTLKEHSIEDGRGSAAAGLIIGFLGLVAQACIIIVAMKLTSAPKV